MLIVLLYNVSMLFIGFVNVIFYSIIRLSPKVPIMNLTVMSILGPLVLCRLTFTTSIIHMMETEFSNTYGS